MFLTVAVLAGPCLAQTGEAARGAGPESIRKGPTTIDAQHIEGVSDLEIKAEGSVELRRDDTTVFSERLQYHQEFGRIEAEGGVRLEVGGDRFTGSRLRYDSTSNTGVFESPSYLIQRKEFARGRAERLEFLGKDHLRLKNSTYTTCAPGRDDWLLRVDELELDYVNDEGRAKGASLDFLDTTIAALPFATFPLERKRKSGFLTPYLSQNTRRGTEFGIPYYWNIAPERDATITPVVMSKRGTQLKTEFRYLDRNYSGDARLEVLPNDDQLKRSRSGFSLQHSHQVTPALFGRLDLNRVSDDRYFVDLSSQVRQVSVSNLQREAYLQYSGSIGTAPYALSARLQRFQTLQDPLQPIVAPYHRMPQLNFATGRSDIGGLFDLSLPVEFVRFEHGALVEGTRFTVNPTLSAPLLRPGAYVTPKLGLRYTGYHLDRTAPNAPTRPDISLPWLSVDAGLVFERPVDWFGAPVVQTLEPRLYYVRVPHRDQTQIPLFDTALSDFNYASIFSENRFSGGDRVGDADQITLAATTRALTTGGQESLRATLGQRFYFRDETVGLTPATPLRSFGSSDLLASVGGRVARDWSFDGSVQHGTRSGHVQRYSVSLRYAPEIAKVLNASYRFNRDLLRQVDVSGQWPVGPGWYAVGRYNYSFQDGRLLEGLGGIEYNAGCWAFRAVYQRLQATTGITSTALFFQLELTGLGQIGTGNAVNLLRRSVPGYASTSPRDRALVPPGVRQPLPFEQVY